MILLPIGHDELVVRSLPFATVGIILLCFVVYFPTSSRIEKDAVRKSKALAELTEFSETHDYLKLPDDLVQKMHKIEREVYETRQGWVDWYFESTQVVLTFLEEESEVADHGRPGTGQLTDLLSTMQNMPGSKMAKLSEVHRDMALSNESKVQFLRNLSSLEVEDIESDQQELFRLYDYYQKLAKSSLLDRFPYVPAKPGIVGLIAHQFLHGGVFHLLFNMLFLWLAAVKLEDLWTRPVFFGVFLLSGIVGALAHGAAHPDSTTPLIGASGAVAGLMGAFLVRLARANIKFFYCYWFFTGRPRIGTFVAPAYLMLPLWFLGELGSAVLFNFGFVAYWSHVGGFLMGVAIALAFKFLDFERRVLGREPEVRIDRDQLPLVAFQTPPPPPLTPVDEEEGRVDSIQPVPPPLENPAVDTEAGQSRFNLKEVAVTGISKDRLNCSIPGQGEVELSLAQVSLIAAGRVDRLDHNHTGEYFSSGMVPAEPALVMVIGQTTESGLIPGYVLDGGKLPYTDLMRKTFPARQKNFVAVTRMLMELSPAAQYVPGPGPVAENNLPIYTDLEQFSDNLRKFITGSTEPPEPGSQT